MNYNFKSMSNEETMSWKEQLSQMYSIFPTINNKPVEDYWPRWCKEKREFKKEDFIGRDAAIAAGPASGLLIVETTGPVDLELPKTMVVRAGESSKLHHYFNYPDSLKYYSKPYPERSFNMIGIDGYVMAPGTISPYTGEVFEIINDIPIADIPRSLLHLFGDDYLIGSNLQWGNEFIKGRIDYIPLIDEILHEDGPLVIAGQKGVGKNILGLNLALGIGSGMPFLWNKFAIQGPLRTVISYDRYTNDFLRKQLQSICNTDPILSAGLSNVVIEGSNRYNEKMEIGSDSFVRMLQSIRKEYKTDLLLIDAQIDSQKSFDDLSDLCFDINLGLILLYDCDQLEEYVSESAYNVLEVSCTDNILEVKNQWTNEIFYLKMDKNKVLSL